MSSGCQGTLLWWWAIWYWLAFKQAFRRALGVKGEGWVVFPNVRELGRRLDIRAIYTRKNKTRLT